MSLPKGAPHPGLPAQDGCAGPVAELTAEDARSGATLAGRARRLVRSALESEADDLVSDAELIISELVSNAVLHGRPPLRCAVTRSAGVWRLEVGDSGESLPSRVSAGDEAMSGRGLAVVDRLSDRWGVQPHASGGKVVWAELRADRPRGADLLPGGPAFDLDAQLELWAGPGIADPDPARGGGPQLTHEVRIEAVPTELLRKTKVHTDNVVRELTLMRSDDGPRAPTLPSELERVVEIVEEFADVRTQLKRQVFEACRRRQAVTDVVLRLPVSCAGLAERYLEALEETDRWARSAHLLTLAAPRSQRLLRRWYLTAVIEHLRAVEAGLPPPVPQPFADVAERQLDDVDRLEDLADRFRILQRLHQDLAAASDPHDMARIGLRAVAEHLAVLTGRVYLLEGKQVCCVAAHGQLEPRNSYDTFDIDDDIPGAWVLRTGRPLFLRSRREIYSQFPEIRGHYSSERSLHVVPLAGSPGARGLLAVTFAGGQVADEYQLALVQAVAEALAQALRRARLAGSDRAARDTLSFLVDATQVLLTEQRPEHVMQRLVRLAVPRLGDWCTVYLADGDVLRRVAMAISDHQDVIERLLGIPLPLDADVPHTRAYHTGVPQPIPARMGRLIRDLYGIDPAEVGADREGGTGLAVPIVLRGRSIGVLAMTFLTSGRQVDGDGVAALSGLADRAAIAWDNAHRWSNQQQLVTALVDAILPDQPPTVPGWSLVARYLPAGGQVAGDWWEASLLPDGTMLIGLGDAAGHGLDAVAKMTELRHAARALALVSPSPAQMLAELGRHLGDDPSFATAVYGRLEPASGRIRWANAGHLPPILLRGGGRPVLLDQTGIPALGAPSAGPGPDATLHLGAGDTLVLYSDGLIERRGRRLEDGLAALAATLHDQGGAGLATMADAIIAGLCSDASDDCCLLLVRRKADRVAAATSPTG